MKKCCREYLMEQIGDPGAVADVYSEYVRNMSTRLVRLEKALGCGDWDLTDKIAHTIKGDALSVGDAESAIAAAALRSSAKAGDCDACAAHLAKLREEFDAL